MEIYTSQPALDFIAQAREEVRQGDQAVIMVTVVEAIGSNPQAVGARLLLSADGTIKGTVGGGKIEARILDDAQEMLAQDRPARLQSYNLQEIGMTCGGKMSFFLEPIHPAPRLFIFGAGHVSAPTAALGAKVGFQVTVIDERTDWATPERFPDVEVSHDSFETFLETFVPQPHHYLVMVSQGHSLDKEILKKVLDGPQRYTGVIGSKQKAHKLKKEMLAAGFSEALWSKVHCPMGVPIGGDTAEEIAVSIVGQLIQVRHQNR